MTLSQGDRLGRYEVLGPIGAGGMGEVWRARDTELDRDVAVKILPESFASDANRLERFQREAKALAALTHPNLLEIYDVGTTDGLHYAVTELLEGDTLRERITPTGLPWKKVTTIGAAVADGLAAAHGRGIIHRDLKPENLFLTADGRVKILDFGLASVHEEASADAETATITEAGTVMGTPGYMAPEQVKGKQADARSDIFSLGCVIYEMASGHRAFRGETGVEVIANILKEEPPQLSSSGASVPVDLERAVHRCLEKRPEARFQSAADLGYSLKNIGTTKTSPAMARPSTVTSVGERLQSRWLIPVVITSLVLAAFTISWAVRDRAVEESPIVAAPALNPNRIAIVPFANRSDDPSLDAIGRRVAGGIIEGLSDIDELETVSLNVVAGTVEGRVPLGAEARAIVNDVAVATSAGLVVTGVMYSSLDEIELQATLENAITGRIVRGFDIIRAAPQDLDPAIDNLAGWIFVSAMDELHPSLRFGAGDRIPDPDAFREFLAALPIAGIDPAAYDHFNRALELDPEFDRARLYGAFASWGASAWQLSNSLVRPLEENRARLTSSQQRLLDAARWGLEGRWVGTLGILQEYSAEHPKDHMARYQATKVAIFANRPRSVLETFRDYRWDPIQPSNQFKMAHFYAAAAHHRLGQHEQELAVLRQLWDQHQRFHNTTWYREPEAKALAALGWIDECRSVIAEALTEPSSGPERQGMMLVDVAEELRAHGHIEESRKMAERAIEWFDRTDLPSHLATKVRLSLIAAFTLLDRNSEAHEVAEELLASDPDRWDFQGVLGIEAARLGDRATADKMSKQLASVDAPFTMGGPSYARAAIAAQMGERDEAIRLVQQAITRGFHEYGRLHVDIEFDPIRNDPEFQEIMRPKG